MFLSKVVRKFASYKKRQKPKSAPSSPHNMSDVTIVENEVESLKASEDGIPER
jgi:hypothetical protein